jgi:hypothetical protein
MIQILIIEVKKYIILNYDFHSQGEGMKLQHSHFRRVLDHALTLFINVHVGHCHSSPRFVGLVDIEDDLFIDVCDAKSTMSF